MDMRAIDTWLDSLPDEELPADVIDTIIANLQKDIAMKQAILKPLPKRPLPRRITAYLQRHAPTPQHLNDIARAIHASRLATENAVHRMSRDGRVRWVGEGTYTLREEP
jgi:hypothetical protein